MTMQITTADQPPTLDPPADPPQPITITPHVDAEPCARLAIGGSSGCGSPVETTRPSGRIVPDLIVRMSRDHFEAKERETPIAHCAVGGGYALDNLADVLLADADDQLRLFGLTSDQTSKLREWCRSKYRDYLAVGVYLPVMFTMRIQLGRAGTEVQIRYEGERGKPEGVLALTMLT